MQGKFKTIELFAGAGGLALGVEKAGFDTIALIEIDKDAADTLKLNRPEWNVINDDIANVSNKNLLELFDLKIGELDMLSGGSPCQSFSYAGKRLGLEDARGTLFYHYAVFLQKLQPKTFLFENVKGLLTQHFCLKMSKDCLLTIKARRIKPYPVYLRNAVMLSIKKY